MSRITNPDDATDAIMVHQQEQDLGHPLDEDDPVDAGTVDEIKRLPEGVDADGLIRGAQQRGEDPESEAERREAVSRVKKQGASDRR